MTSPRRRWIHQVTASALWAGLSPWVRAQPRPAALRITALPEEPGPELARRLAPLLRHLESALGQAVEFVPASDQATAIDFVVSKRADMAWLSGYGLVQALARAEGRLLPLVQREEDERNRSVFIASDPAIRRLTDLRGKTFSFGAQNSATGHLMPRSVLMQAGILAERDFRRLAFSGTHEATLAAVASGKVQAGVVLAATWERRLTEDRQDPIPVHAFHTTARYCDYSWTVHADMPGSTQAQIRRSMLALNRDTPNGKEILELARATRYTETDADNYRAIEAAARSAGLL
ncbi:putative selenate ABC transporter substrate-binding protein [Ideonella sp.]|uniref:putative selenate ABC transporter substrate-binding protein n=1 Tax=Ideonella sp. TaxID=1929293 RepID=UPI003BB4A361